MHISVGDFISVDRSYFGDEYGAQFPQSIQRFYGRVTYMYGAQNSKVKRDIDGYETVVSIDKFKKERRNTPSQTPVYAAVDDSQQHKHQTTSSDVASPHPLIVEGAIPSESEADFTREVTKKDKGMDKRNKRSSKGQKEREKRAEDSNGKVEGLKKRKIMIGQKEAEKKVLKRKVLSPVNAHGSSSTATPCYSLRNSIYQTYEYTIT